MSETTDPAIRAALDSAHGLLSRACVNGALRPGDTATAIALFLAKLHALVPLGAMCGPDGREIYTGDLRELAGAVQREARHV